MSLKDRIFFVSTFFLIFMIGGFMSFTLFSNAPLSSVIRTALTKSNGVKADEIQCSSRKPLEISPSAMDELLRLKDYQKVCDSFVTDSLMYFTTLPSDSTNPDLIKKDAIKFFELKQAGIKPIVIMEPYVSDGLMKWSDIGTGIYNTAIAKYFQEIAKFGVTPADWTYFVPLPEPNVPNWGLDNSKPEDFAKAYNQIVSTVKTSWGPVTTSILMNAQSYEASDTEWDNGVTQTYEKYTAGITKGLVDAVGIQGFPWASAANQRKREIFNPRDFLAPEVLEYTAKDLKTKNVWFNTGTFGSKYNLDPIKKITVLPTTRKQILDDISTLVTDIANKGYSIRVNLFAENKARTPEATDWSYDTSGAKIIVRDFVIGLNKEKIDFSLADK